MTAPENGVTTLRNSVATSGGMNGVGKAVGVLLIAGVRVMVGVKVMEGVMEIVGVSVVLDARCHKKGSALGKIFFERQADIDQGFE